MKHTADAWNIYHGGQYEFMIATVETPRTIIAEVNNTGLTSKANALLMAAAPEMLSALETALTALETNHHLVTNSAERLVSVTAQSAIHLALKKARGEK